MWVGKNNFHFVPRFLRSSQQDSEWRLELGEGLRGRGREQTSVNERERTTGMVKQVGEGCVFPHSGDSSCKGDFTQPMVKLFDHPYSIWSAEQARERVQYRTCWEERVSLQETVTLHPPRQTQLGSQNSRSNLGPGRSRFTWIETWLFFIFLATWLWDQLLTE